MITSVLHDFVEDNDKANKISLGVKLADFEDNLDIKRIAHPNLMDYACIVKYLKYCDEL